MDSMYQGDAGTELRVTLLGPSGSQDLSGATLVEFIFLKPSGARLRVTASLYTDGKDGTVSYLTSAGDLDQLGLWRYQVRVTIGTRRVHSEEGHFKVEEVLD